MDGLPLGHHNMPLSAEYGYHHPMAQHTGTVSAANSSSIHSPMGQLQMMPSALNLTANSNQSMQAMMSNASIANSNAAHNMLQCGSMYSGNMRSMGMYGSGGKSKAKKPRINKDGVPAPKRATTAYINFTQWYREEMKKAGRQIPKAHCGTKVPKCSDCENRACFHSCEVLISIWILVKLLLACLLAAFPSPDLHGELAKMDRQVNSLLLTRREVLWAPPSSSLLAASSSSLQTSSYTQAMLQGPPPCIGPLPSAPPAPPAAPLVQLPSLQLASPVPAPAPTSAPPSSSADMLTQVVAEVRALSKVVTASSDRNSALEEAQSLGSCSSSKRLRKSKK